MRRLISVIWVFTGCIGALWSQQPLSFLATWNFDNMTPSVSTITGNGAPYVNGQDAVFGFGIDLPLPDPPGWYPQGNPSSGLAYSGANWTSSGAPDLTDYIEFCVNSTGGYVFTPGALVGIQFDQRRSSTGPQAYTVRASIDNFSSYSPAGSGTLSGTNFSAKGPHTFTVPASPTVTEICFRIYGYSSTGTSGTWRFDNVQISGPFSLPVTWLRFDAQKAGPTALLQWTTAAELNSDYFAVERSADAVRFAEIGRVPGGGNSSDLRDYAFADEQPLPGVNYYRLRQVDFDGAVQYSPLRSVDFGGQGGALQLYPVPTHGRLYAQLPEGAGQEPIVWSVFDAAGRLVLSGQEAAESQTFSLDAGPMPEGAYLLRAVAGRSVWTGRFVR